MGMSNDFEAAIEEGATIVRVGTALSAPAKARRRRPMNVFRGFLIAAAVLSGRALLAQVNPQREPASDPIPKVIVFSNVPVPMRDKVLLSADVYVPTGSGRWPTILIRTPYNRHSETSRGYRLFAEHGFAVVTQDVRGRYGSDGKFGSVAQEGPDGNDTLNWIARQPWSNGRIGMAGASYVGIVQWWAAVQKIRTLATFSRWFRVTTNTWTGTIPRAER